MNWLLNRLFESDVTLRRHVPCIIESICEKKVMVLWSVLCREHLSAESKAHLNFVSLESKQYIYMSFCFVLYMTSLMMRRARLPKFSFMIIAFFLIPAATRDGAGEIRLVSFTNFFIYILFIFFIHFEKNIRQFRNFEIYQFWPPNVVAHGGLFRNLWVWTTKRRGARLPSWATTVGV
jgi:hypothetical protein